MGWASHEWQRPQIWIKSDVVVLNRPSDFPYRGLVNSSGSPAEDDERALRRAPLARVCARGVVPISICLGSRLRKIRDNRAFVVEVGVASQHLQEFGVLWMR